MIIDYAEKLHAWASKDQKKIEITKDHLVEVFAQKLKIQKNKIVLPENEFSEDVSEVLKKAFSAKIKQLIKFQIFSLVPAQA